MRRPDANGTSSRARRPRAGLVALRRAALLLLLVACGSRTGLFVDNGAVGPEPADAGRDARIGRDAAFIDGPEEDALPPIDARPPEDVDRRDCPDADATLVYVITEQYELFSFYPPDGTFKSIGKIACPADPNATPFSMAVNRKGIAYILFNDGNLFRVSTATAACIATPFKPDQGGYHTFGMGFATNAIGPTETLYVAGDGQNGAASGLARIDTTTFALSPVGDFTPPVERAELTGTGDGRLFAFYAKNQVTTPTFIGEIDTTTANVIAENRFDTVDLGHAWAFAYWGGDFFMFTAANNSVSSDVTRFRPADGSVVQVATLPTTIVGAGVSTCAPQQ